MNTPCNKLFPIHQTFLLPTPFHQNFPLLNSSGQTLLTGSKRSFIKLFHPPTFHLTKASHFARFLYRMLLACCVYLTGASLKTYKNVPSSNFSILQRFTCQRLPFLHVSVTECCLLCMFVCMYLGKPRQRPPECVPRFTT